MVEIGATSSYAEHGSRTPQRLRRTNVQTSGDGYAVQVNLTRQSRAHMPRDTRGHIPFGHVCWEYLISESASFAAI